MKRTTEAQIFQLEAMADIRKGAPLSRYGSSFLLEIHPSSPNPQPIGLAARDIQRGETVWYNTEADTADIVIAGKHKRKYI